MRLRITRRWIVLGACAALAVTLALFAIATKALRGNSLTGRVTAALSAALNCEVSMDPLQVKLLPKISVSGTNFAVRLRNRPDLPPFIHVDQFDVNLGLLSVVRRRIEVVHLDGLHMNVPPRLAESFAASGAAEPTTPAPWTGTLFRVDRVITHDAVINFVAKKAGGRPLMFDVHNLELNDASIDAPIRFVADLKNPVPEGKVYSRGTFGPWNRLDPTLTPLDGAYTLTDADLGTINGIGGKATSSGTFTGMLTEIHAAGTSDTPNFSLDLGGKPVSLSTKFQVTVDGSDGATVLNRVEAQLANTTILVTGFVANLPGPKNHDVVVNAEVKDGRIEDLMRLAIDSPGPLVSGAVSLKAILKLPPGKGSPQYRLNATGSAHLVQARFTDKEMNAKISDLSRRGLGKKENETVPVVPVDLNGIFKLEKGLLTLTRTEVQVPGALIQVAGTYALGSEAVNFSGEALLDASLSTAVGGVKSIFLKPFNSLFRKNGAGAVVPIRITGTRPSPIFAVRKGAIFGKDEKPKKDEKSKKGGGR